MPNLRLDELSRDQLLTTVRRLLVETEALSSRIAAVNEIGIAISRTHDLDEILRVVAKQAKWLLDFEHCSVCLRTGSTSWRIQTLFGTLISHDFTEEMETGDIGSVLKTGQSRLIRTSAGSGFLSQFGSQIIIALTSEERRIGAITFARTPENAYTQDDLRVGYLLALQLSAAIRNAEHFQELKRAEDELRRYNDELEARNQELDAYSHTIAHDLKTPLSTIVLKADMVKRLPDTHLSPKAETYLNDTKTAALNMAKMVDQLLLLAKLRDASEAIISVRTDETVRAAILRFQEQIDSRCITVEVSQELPPALGHEQWIEEVFANLVGNAIKYMGEENPNKRICIRGYKQGDMVRYEVQDTGVGIAPEDQQRLFTMFTRLHTVTADGLGLGLSIVHRIVTRLKGKLGVESMPGEGSTFWFMLPSP
jgi:signal transduction histidine kinase